MRLIHNSELMKNQKHAGVMAPDKAFEVIRTPTGSSLFFSIGTDNILYVTREITGASAARTGWTRKDLSSKLVASQKGEKTSVKMFALCQHPDTTDFDILLVLTVDGLDIVFMSDRNASTEATWEKDLNWTPLPFDAIGESVPEKLNVTDVYLAHTGTGKTARHTHFIDVHRSSNDPWNSIERYFIDKKTTPHWNRHSLPVEMRAGTIKSTLGRRKNDLIGGIYTLGAVGGIIDKHGNELLQNETPRLIFAPESNPFQPDVPVNAARLNLPAEARHETTALASSLDSAGTTSLFVAASGGLFLYPPDQQKDGSDPLTIIPPENKFGCLTSVTSLTAATLGEQTVVIGLNAQGHLFRTQCSVGLEQHSYAWSAPVPILKNVQNYAFYLYETAGSVTNVLFAHTTGNRLVRIVRDPTSTLWTERSILLPSMDLNDVVEYHSFTTHITTVDDDGVAKPNVEVTITPDSHTSVYIDDVYHVLSANIPLKLVSDDVGHITIVQETQTLAAVSFEAKMDGTPEVVEFVNPMTKAHAKLAAIKDGTDLDKNLTMEDGTTQPLIPSDVPTFVKKQAASALANLNLVHEQLLAKETGNPKPSKEPPPSFGFVFPKKGSNEMRSARSLSDAGDFFTDWLAKSVSAELGDIINYVRQATDNVVGFLLEKVEDGWKFVCEIGKNIYRAMLDTVHAVLSTITIVFDEIKATFDKMVAFLGFIFDFEDILRTTNALKKVFNGIIDCGEGMLGVIQQQAHVMFGTAQRRIDEWSQVQDIGKTMSESLRENSKGEAYDSSHSPQAQWASHHFKNGVADIKGSTDKPISVPRNLIDALEVAARKEADDVEAAVKEIVNTITNMRTMTAMTAAKQITGACAKLLAKSIENIMDALVALIRAVFQGIKAALNEPLEIPVLSWMYRKMTGKKDLRISILDIMCFIIALPATILYKLIVGTAPIPNNEDPKWLEFLKPQTLADLFKNVDPKTMHLKRSLSASAGEAEPNGLALAAVTDDSSSKKTAARAISIFANIVATSCCPPIACFQLNNLQGSQLASLAEAVVSVFLDLPSIAWIATGILTDGLAWPWYMNTVFSLTSIGLKCIGGLVGTSPALSTVNIFITVMLVGVSSTGNIVLAQINNETEAADWVSWSADVSSGLSSLGWAGLDITTASTRKPKTVVDVGLWTGAFAAEWVYAGLSVATAFLRGMHLKA